MFVPTDCLSVLVIDEDPDILSFLARVLDNNGMRALLARNAQEAMGIAKRGYVPIDVALTDIVLRPDANQSDLTSGHDLIERLRDLRPEVRAVYMSAQMEAGVIRIKLMDRGFQTTSKNPDDQGIIASIRSAAAAPMVYSAGGPVQ
jgi:DNA-binding NtrC family response regulator